MDLSKWDSYTNGERSGFLLALIAATEGHIMPPQKYVWMHPKAKLSEVELSAIKRWAIAERAAIPKKTVRRTQLSESVQLDSAKR